MRELLEVKLLYLGASLGNTTLTSRKSTEQTIVERSTKACGILAACQARLLSEGRRQDRDGRVAATTGKTPAGKCLFPKAFPLVSAKAQNLPREIRSLAQGTSLLAFSRKRSSLGGQGAHSGTLSYGMPHNSCCRGRSPGSQTPSVWRKCTTVWVVDVWPDQMQWQAPPPSPDSPEMPGWQRRASI